MRDVLLALILAYFSLRALRYPWIGVMLWTLLSILNPHKYSWQLDSQPVAAIMAVCTLVGILVSKDRKSFPLTRESLMLLLLMAWFSITLLGSFNIEGSYDQWKKVMKIDFMILVTLLVLHTRRHIMALTWVLVFSLGYYGVKGGVFTITTGGQYRVWGPLSTYIEGNNELALALIMTIPLMQYLRGQMQNRWVRHGLLLSRLLCAAAALGSHSRGALVAIAAMAMFLWWRSKGKLIAGIALVTAAVLMIGFMPENWTQRMDTITDYQDDASAMGRINAWQMAWNLAKQNFLGGGFDIYTYDVFLRYAPNPEDIHAAHSIYFQILGEHGFVGLFIFVLMWIFVWSSAGKLRREAVQQVESAWLADLGAMCQVSLVGFAVGGAFLSLAYFDLPYIILVLVVLGRRWIAEQAWRTEVPGAPGTGALARLMRLFASRPAPFEGGLRPSSR